jgi:3-oxoadipate enol-lactonase
VKLLFLHGAGFTGDVFEQQLRAFPEAQAPNLPGHLCEGAPKSIGEFADEVGTRAEQAGFERTVVCGHSMGGAVALELALRQPPWLAGAILLGAGARMRVAPAFLEGLESDFEATARRLAGYFFAHPAPERIEGAVNSMRRVGQAQTLRDFRACDAFDVLDRLESIRLPMLAVTGQQDALVPAKHAAALADRVPAARSRIVEGAGHFVMIEQPAETNETVAAFLRGLS